MGFEVKHPTGPASAPGRGNGLVASIDTCERTRRMPIMLQQRPEAPLPLGSRQDRPSTSTKDAVDAQPPASQGYLSPARLSWLPATPHWNVAAPAGVAFLVMGMARVRVCATPPAPRHERWWRMAARNFSMTDEWDNKIVAAGNRSTILSQPSLSPI